MNCRVGIAWSWVLVAACAPNNEGPSVGRPATATGFDRAPTQRAMACENDRNPDNFKSQLPATGSPELDTRRFPAEAKQDLKARIIASRSTTRSSRVALLAALPDGAIQEEKSRRARFAEEEARLRAQYGTDEAGYTQARAAAKAKIILGSPQ